MNEMPAMISASTTAAWRCSAVVVWKKPIETSVTTPAKSRGAEREPEQLHGLHQIAAGGAVVAHAGSFWSAGADAASRCSSDAVRLRLGLSGDRRARREAGDREVDGDDRGVGAEDPDADRDAGEGEGLLRLVDRVLQRVLRRHEEQGEARARA